MKLTTKSRYGLRAMTYIAAHAQEGQPVPLSEIAEALILSEAYLEQLLRLLKKVPLVKAVRGVKGGYVPARDPKDITVMEMLNVLEGEFWLSDCAIAGDCPGGFSNCPTRILITRMNNAIYQSIENLTLADMVELSLAV